MKKYVMLKHNRHIGRLFARLAAAAVLATAGGCTSLELYHAPAPTYRPIISPAEPPREKCMASLPAYQIEPPDLIQIEVLKMVPRPPYRLELYDVLQVQVIGTLLDQPISGFYLIEGEGTVNLGPAYGTVRVAGMTVDEATKAITEHLKQTLAQPEASVQLSRTSGTQPITGVYLVGPDGTINLRQYGVVHVAGRTMMEARVAIQRHLEQFFDSPDVSVDMTGYNSKVYYVITEGAGLGDNVVRIPITGNETVLDALSQIGGLSQISSKKIWIARPAPAAMGCEQILPVDWDSISRGGGTATNYQMMPGDRLFVAEDSIVASNNFLAKITAPIERLLGLTSLGASTVRNTQTLGRAYNRQRSN